VGDRIGGLFGSMGSGGGLAGSWKLIAGVAAVLAVVVVVFAGGLPFMAPSGKGQYAETKAIWDQVQNIRKGGSNDEWSKFSTATLPRVKQLQAELEPIATADRRLVQLMLFSNRDCLPVMMAGKLDDNKAVWKEMESYMTEAEAILAQ
jgi:hypothetical protein